MEEMQIIKQEKILNKLISQHESSRAFAREIGEDSSDIFRWAHKGKIIHIRAAVKIVKLFGVKPNDIRPDIFDTGTEIIFNKDR